MPAARTTGRRAAAAGLACLLLVACTGHLADRARPPAGADMEPSLELAVVARPLDCRPTADIPAGCAVGGSSGVFAAHPMP